MSGKAAHVKRCRRALDAVPLTGFLANVGSEEATSLKAPYIGKVAFKGPLAGPEFVNRPGISI
jgi:hypothetical protein